MAESYGDIPYAPSSTRDTFREFDLYLCRAVDNAAPQSAAKTSNGPPLICFVHGGAWRSEDKADHSALAIRLTSLTKLPVVVPNYRLTPINPTKDDDLHHPSHAEDILQLLAFLLTWEGPEGLGLPYDPNRLYLMGHSCSAHMLASIFLDSSAVTPSLTPSPSLLRSVQAIVMSEGLHDLELLIASFPRYKEWFLANAFGQRGSFAEFSTTRFPLRGSDVRVKWLVIHSPGDTLVDILQSQLIYKHLCQLHKDAGMEVERQVTANMEELTEDHNDILRGEAFVRIVAEYVLADAHRERI